MNLKKKQRSGHGKNIVENGAKNLGSFGKYNDIY